MDTFAVIREHKDEILLKWYECLIAANSKCYSGFGFEEFKPRMEKIFNHLSQCDSGKLSPEAQNFVYHLAQERMSQEYNYWDLLTVFRTFRKALREILGPEIFSRDISEYDKVIVVFEEAYQVLSEGYLDYQISVIEALHKNLLELSTPVIPVDDKILVMPLIGTIDTFRADQIMEAILREVTGRQAEAVIIDITGVPIVDTAVANHLMRTVRAVRLVGGKCIMVGVRPEIAQTLVRLDISFPDINTAATLKMGLNLARQLLNQ